MALRYQKTKKLSGCNLHKNFILKNFQTPWAETGTRSFVDFVLLKSLKETTDSTDIKTINIDVISQMYSSINEVQVDTLVFES